MDDKVKLTKCQNHHHHGGVFDTQPARQGPTGRPARVWGGSAWVLAATHLHNEEKPKSVEKVIQGPIHPYKYPPHGQSQHTTHFVVLHL
jgi:hypothetical protein